MTRLDRLKHLAIIVCFFIVCALYSALSNAQTINMTLATTSADGRSVVPRLTWSVTPAPTSCTASGASDWTGSKPASGDVTLAAVTTSRTFSLVCNWAGVTRATLAWTAPTTNTDGSAYTNPNGYRIRYGTAADALNTSVYVTEPARTWESPNLAPGPWFFGVNAVNTLGLEGGLSNIVSKTATAGASQTRALELAIKFPGAPVLE